MSQKLDRLVADNLDLWTGSTLRKSGAGRGGGKRISLYGIERLRALILDLAVRGKLVPQDARDEQQSDARLQNGPPLSFTVPTSWRWVTVNTVADCRLGKMLDASKNKGELKPYLRNANVRWFDFDLSSLVQMRFEPDELREFDLQVGDVLVCEGGEPGRAAVWDGRVTDIYFQKAIHRVRLNKLVSPVFFALCIKRSAETGELRSYFTGSGIQHFTGRNLDRFAFPLPPLAEQQRIVAKVDALMALCDALARASEGAMAAHQVLVGQLLATLLNSARPADLSADWARLETHFDTLFTTDASIDALKQAMLDLAVRGKLVEQDAGDEGAASLLKRIQAERSKVLGETQASKVSASIDDKGGLPFGWEWTPLARLGLAMTGGTPKSSQPENFNGIIPFIGPGQISPDGNILPTEKLISDLGLSQSNEAIDGDILMVCIGGSIGKSAIVLERTAFNQQINAIRPLIADSRFVDLYLRCSKFQSEVLDRATGSATPIINRGKWETIPVAVPPLAEQHRIVAKVDALLALCAQLKARLADAAQTQRHLADAITERAAA